MELLPLAVLTFLIIVARSLGAVDLSADPEEEALFQIFASDMDRHTGVNRLRWHVAQLKGITEMLTIMNLWRVKHEERSDPWYMNTFEEEWRMLDIMIGLNILSRDTDLKHDLFVGDVYVFPKIARHVDREMFAMWLTDHINKWGNDFFKYIVQDDDFGYNITDPTGFIDAVYNIRDPTTFARSVGMTLQQLGKMNGYLKKAMIVRHQYWEMPMLGMEIVKQMCELGIMDCDASTVHNAEQNGENFLQIIKAMATED